MRYTNMTPIQDAVLPVILGTAGGASASASASRVPTDVLAKAKTGTGKTLAFLIPTVEILEKDLLQGNDASNSAITALILAPARELASQITQEALDLLHFNKHLRDGVVCVYGGTNINTDKKHLNAGKVSILVATPGRLIDHLENTPGFSARLKKCKMLIMDEADQL